MPCLNIDMRPGPNLSLAQIVSPNTVLTGPFHRRLMFWSQKKRLQSLHSEKFSSIRRSGYCGNFLRHEMREQEYMCLINELDLVCPRCHSTVQPPESGAAHLVESNGIIQPPELSHSSPLNVFQSISRRAPAQTLVSSLKGASPFDILGPCLQCGSCLTERYHGSEDLIVISEISRQHESLTGQRPIANNNRRLEMNKAG